MTAFRRRSLPKEKPLGELLREARLAKRLSLEALEEQTRIRSRFIAALEREDYNLLPPIPYTAGFIRRLARTLELPEEVLVRRFRRERRVFEAMGKPKARVPEAIRLPPIVITPRLFVWLAGLGAVSSVAGYIGWQVAGFAAAPPLEIQSPASGVTVQAEVIEVVGTTGRGATLEIQSQPVSLKAGGQFREELRLHPGLNQIVIVARNRVGKETRKEIVLYRE